MKDFEISKMKTYGLKICRVEWVYKNKNKRPREVEIYILVHWPVAHLRERLPKPVCLMILVTGLSLFHRFIASSIHH